jgi:anaerobic magnesium-protoporphyrin IX monomethyl ester cyclase
VVEIAGRWIPLNFVYLGGAARQAGLTAEIYDAMAKDHGYPEIEKRLRESNADYVASTAVTSTINDAIKTLDLAKKIKPDTVTILGGVHPTFMYKEVLASSTAVDYIVVGEGEISFSQLLTALEAGGDPAAIPGLAFRRSDAIIKTPVRSFMGSIDDLPAAWDLIDWPDYTYNFISDSRMGAVSTSRGCGSHDSVFCTQHKFWENSWRARDPKKVVDELEYLYTTFQVNVFLITDEYPTRDRERWEFFLDLLIARGLPIYLLIETRPSDIIRDREIIGKYQKAGVVYISIGIWATCQAALGKDPGVDEAKQTLDLIHEHGMVTEASFMLGFPDETGTSVKSTLKLARYFNPDNANFFAVTPFPYTDMYADVKQYIRVKDYTKYNLVDPVIEPEAMSILQMEIALAECYRKFYMGKIIEVMTMKDDFKRRYMMRATKLFMGSPFILKKLSLGVLGKLGMRQN